MSELQVPAKLVRLCKMILSNTSSTVEVKRDFLGPFASMRGFTQGDLYIPNSLTFSLWRVLCGMVQYNAMEEFSADQHNWVFLAEHNYCL